MIDYLTLVVDPCLDLELCYIPVYSFLNIIVFRFQKTYAYLAYNLDDTKTTVVEFEYDYGVTEYNHGTGYAQVYEDASLPDLYLPNLVFIC